MPVSFQRNGGNVMAVTVGISGLGIMGTGMSLNLIRKGGHKVVGYDIDKGRRDALKANGGEPLASNAEVAKAADLVICSLPSAAALDAVVNGKDGIIASGRKGLVVLECSTLAIETKEKARAQLEAAGMVMLDAPVSGAGKQAEAGELSIMVSGDQAAYAKAEPIFASYCKAWRHVGAFGMGMKLKLIINMLISIHGAAYAEAIAIAQKAGVPLDLLHQCVTIGAGNSRVIEYRGPLMIKGVYGDPDTKTVDLPIQIKDNDVISNFIKSLHVPTPTFNSSMPYYEAAYAQGWVKEDPGVITRIAEMWSGLKQR